MLQRLVFDRLDGDLRWLEALGAPVQARETGNPLTTGVRFDPAGLTRALAGAAGPIRLGTRLVEPPDTGCRSCSPRAASARSASS